MKQLTDYITEKANFLVKKHVASTVENNNDFVIMRSKDGESLENTKNIEECDVRKIHLDEPIKPFVIYKDKYHETLHIASFSDMVYMTSMYADDDFEDFGPKDIVKMFDTLEEACKYALQTGGKELTKYYDKSEWAENVVNNGESDPCEFFDIRKIDPADTEAVYKEICCY